jgi:hypothetical protein
MSQAKVFLKFVHQDSQEFGSDDGPSWLGLTLAVRRGFLGGHRWACSSEHDPTQSGSCPNHGAAFERNEAPGLLLQGAWILPVLRWTAN